jgi:plasmid maintenance system antidote protein VapI
MNLITKTSYQNLIIAELDTPVAPKLRAFAAHAAAGFGNGARAVLQCNPAKSGSIAGELLLYVVVSEYDSTHDSRLMKRVNRLMPPVLMPLTLSNITAELAVISEDDIVRLSRSNEQSTQIWSDLAGPVRLLWTADDNARKMAIRAVMGAPPTLLNAALAHMEREVDVFDLWQLGFDLALSFSLAQVSGPDRVAQVLDDPLRYDEIGRAALCHTMIASEFRGDRVHLLDDPESRIVAELERWPALRRRASWEGLGRQLLNIPS